MQPIGDFLDRVRDRAGAGKASQARLAAVVGSAITIELDEGSCSIDGATLVVRGSAAVKNELSLKRELVFTAVRESFGITLNAIR